MVVTANVFCSAHRIAVLYCLPGLSFMSVTERLSALTHPLQVSSQALVIAVVHTCMPLLTYALPFRMLPETS